jgi:hypothetical protein
LWTRLNNFDRKKFPKLNANEAWNFNNKLYEKFSKIPLKFLKQNQNILARKLSIIAIII